MTVSKSQEPRTVLEAAVSARQETREETVRAFLAMARTMGVSTSMTARHLNRLMAGQAGIPNPGTRRVLAALFERPIPELLSPWTAESDAAPVALVTTPPRTQELIQMAARRARAFTLFSESGVSAESVEQIHEEVADLATAYPVRPVAELLGDLVETQEGVYALLEQHGSRPSTTRQLLVLAGVVGGMLAKVSHDTGNSRAASAQARAAFLAAEQAEHDGLRAWIRGLQSLVAYWVGRHADSVAYAQQGQLFRPTGTVSAWLPVSEARAWAAMGRAEQTHAALTTAEQAWETVQPDDLDELGGICRFSRARTTYYGADATAWLARQDPATAER